MCVCRDQLRSKMLTTSLDLVNYRQYNLTNNILCSVESNNILTNVSSNAYYGYQPQIHTGAKHCFEPEESDLLTNKRLDTDVQFDNAGEIIEYMQTESDIRRQSNRKRRWDHADDFNEFKKRRENENYKTDLKRVISKEEEEKKLLEDILRETHGADMYRWLCSEA